MTGLRLPAGLRPRVSLLLTVTCTLFLSLTVLLWGWSTRTSIHEEIEAAHRVAAQWLLVMTREDLAPSAPVLQEQLAAVGRLRANVLEIHGADGQLLYRSPAPTYKAGREAPVWFADLLTPQFEGTHLRSAGLSISLQPDASRAVLDAWDELVQFAGWALALLLLIAGVAHHVLARALAPLTRLQQALERTGEGDFAQRLPLAGSVELDRLSTAYNRMVERLEQSLVTNARLEEDQAFVRAVNARLEEERRALARELHDELGQGLTAVRAIAAAIAQRCTRQAGIHGSAQAMLALSAQLQDGVRAILERLRQHKDPFVERVDLALAGYCEHWASCYPDLQLEQILAPVNRPLQESFCLNLLRLLQESLTNVVRHAHARHARVELACDTHGISLSISDDGIGFDPDTPSERYGLAGMRERVTEHGGCFAIHAQPDGGSEIAIALPWPDLHS